MDLLFPNHPITQSTRYFRSAAPAAAGAKRATTVPRVDSTDKISLALFANSEYNASMILKPQDVVVLLKLGALREIPWSYASLAGDLFMSASEVHAGIKRAIAARMMDPEGKRALKRPLEEFLIHGVKYAYPPDRGGLTRGMPTGYAAAPLNAMISPSPDPPPVWPDPEGDTRGNEFSPLYNSVPKAVRKDSKLYELLALVDAIRDGRAREREIAIRDLKARLSA